MTIETPEQYRDAMQRLEELKTIVPHRFAWGCNSERDQIESAIWRYQREVVRSTLVFPTPMIDRLRESDIVDFSIDGNQTFYVETSSALQPLTAPELEQLIDELKTIRQRMKG